jgi:hypothetical protein
MLRVHSLGVANLVALMEAHRQEAHATAAQCRDDPSATPDEGPAWPRASAQREGERQDHLQP